MHQAFDARPTDPVATSTQLGVDTSCAVRLPNLLMDRANQAQRMHIGQPFAARCAPGLPSAKAAPAHRQGLAQDSM